jgi:hypothetical protein
MLWTALGTPRLLASDLRFSSDGARGYLFGADRALSVTETGVAFGAGIENCLWFITALPGVEPRARKRCGAVSGSLVGREKPSAARERELARFRAGTRGNAPAFTWNSSLPLYVDRLVVDGTLLLARNHGPSELIITTSAWSEAEVPVLRAPSGGFVGCKAAGCLWAMRGDTSTWIAWVSRDSLARLLRSAEASVSGAGRTESRGRRFMP